MEGVLVNQYNPKTVCLLVQRPRKVGAKYTGSDIAPDEYVQPQLDFDYDGKRDHWNGYDISEHKHIVDEYQKLEEVCEQYVSILITLTR